MPGGGDINVVEACQGKAWNRFSVIQEEDEDDDEPPPLIADGLLKYARNDGILSGDEGYNVVQQLRGRTHKPGMMKGAEAKQNPGIRPIRPSK